MILKEIWWITSLIHFYFPAKVTHKKCLFCNKKWFSWMLLWRSLKQPQFTFIWIHLSIRFSIRSFTLQRDTTWQTQRREINKNWLNVHSLFSWINSGYKTWDVSWNKTYAAVVYSLQANVPILQKPVNQIG